ncbi:MAG: hypothetical protein J6V37_02650 [Clostridia bacterium]|nr:hypothetical protein [Clostridia bacterium]
MKTKTKLVLLITVISLCIVATATGVTVAYWVGAKGSNQIAPQTDTTDWNYYSKYFIYEEIRNASNALIGYKIVGFKDTVLENVVIPRYATGGWLRENKDDTTLVKIGEGTTVAVLEVGNSLFAGTTDKAVPVTLTLPTTVEVEPGAFQGLTNLTTVTIKAVDGFNSSTLDDSITIGQNAFFGCDNVTKFIVSTNITFVVPGASITGFDSFKSAVGLRSNLELTVK